MLFVFEKNAFLFVFGANKSCIFVFVILPFSSVTIKASFMKINICKYTKQHCLLVFSKFKIVDLIVFEKFCTNFCVRGISKTIFHKI